MNGTPGCYSLGWSFHLTVWATDSWASRDGVTPQQHRQAPGLRQLPEFWEALSLFPKSLGQEAAFLTLS